MCAHLNACTSLYVSMPVLLHACKRFWVCVCTPTRFRVHVQACVFVLLWSCVHVHACLNMRGDPKMQFIYKKLCIYSYTFKLQSPSKYSSFDAIHPWSSFLHCSKQFLNMLILMLFSDSAVFCFTSSTSAKCFHLRTFFIRETKKSPLGYDG